MNLAICVIAFNRQYELERILENLTNVPENIQVTLLISIDFSNEQNNIASISQSFEWHLGPKKIIIHENSLGLKKHVLACIELANEFDLTVILEEDLIISPFFVNYLEAAYEASNVDCQIGAISLYSYEKNEADKLPFSPLVDSFDNYYMQYPSSWGFAITQVQSKSFLHWMAGNDCDTFNDSDVPTHVRNWGKKSWKKHFCRYLIRNNKYCLYPRFSLSTNPGSDGTHHSGIGGLYSVPVCQTKRDWKIGTLGESLAIYDSEFELSSYKKLKLVINDNYYSLGRRTKLVKSKYINENYYISLIELFELTFQVVLAKSRNLFNKLFR